MSIEKKIKADRNENADSIKGQWLPRREDIEALGRAYAEDAFAQLGGLDPSEVSWSFDPMDGDWSALEGVVGGAADDSEVREAFAGAYERRLREMVE